MFTLMRTSVFNQLYAYWERKCLHRKGHLLTIFMFKESCNSPKEIIESFMTMKTKIKMTRASCICLCCCWCFFFFFSWINTCGCSFDIQISRGNAHTGISGIRRRLCICILEENDIQKLFWVSFGVTES